MTNFKQLLRSAFTKHNSLVCVGLDSDIRKLPFSLKGENRQLEFNKRIIEATSRYVCSYKPNTAFYESEGQEGISTLKSTIRFIKEECPDIPVILDAKRADIGNTNEGYAKFAFDYLSADALTVHPFLGQEAVKPFLDRKDKGIIILCRTSNPGAGELQDIVSDGKPLYQILAERISGTWNYNGNCGVVVGATYPSELEIVRHIVGDMPILIPGVGAQGADTEKTVRYGVDVNGMNAIINSSRGIIFSSSGTDFAVKAQSETAKLRDLINLYRKDAS